MPCCKAEKFRWCKDIPADYTDTEGKEYCVFHAPGKKGISTEEFNRIIFERIEESRKEDAPCVLTGTVFEGDISFGRFNKDNPLPAISLSEAKFIGTVHFVEAEFGKEVDFRGTEFVHEAYFQTATFCGEADFRRAEFREITSFRFAEFRKSVDFSGAKFRMATDFSEAVFAAFTDAAFNMAEFSENVEFWRAKFGSGRFSGSRFDGEVNFRGVHFSRLADFFEVQFNNDVDFWGAELGQSALFAGAKFSKKALFYGETFMEGLFSEVSIEERVKFEKANLKNVSFIDTDLRKIDFINCIWYEVGGRYVLKDEVALSKDRKDKNVRDNIKKVEILYRLLKQKNKEEHNEVEVSNWHYGEKEMQRKGTGLKKLFSFTILNLYRLSSGYGEDPLIAGLNVILLLVLTSLLMGMAGLSVSDGLGSHKITDIFWPHEIDFGKTCGLFLNTLQYITFQKDTFFKPINWTGETIKIFSQILIPLQTALFALALRNRFRR